ncbi:MAG: D-alanyl-D-alanine carboxypeptidase [Holosporales bacterium]|jgi:D-alanyl-D-alanine carboxypeptidase|nr:D-alanyl-D-alanine carboxypeptidase [Holosporales bacterium]
MGTSIAYPFKKASIVMDYSNNKKIVFSENPDAIRYPASLTKTMTVYLLFEALRAGKITLNTKFKTSKLAVMQIPSKIGVKIGEKITVQQLIRALLVKSANDAAVVAAEGMCGSVKKFAVMMNKKAKQLGMKHTHFENPSGVPDGRQVTTARDMLTLGIAVFKYFPQYWNYFSEKSFSYKGQAHNAHCKITRWYKGADGGKTGFICASGFNLFVTAQRYNKNGKQKRMFVVVIGGDSTKSRDLYAAYLMDKFFGEYRIASKIAHLSKQKLKKKSGIMEKVLQTEEEFEIEKALDYSAEIDEFYIDDEESMDIIEEELVLSMKKNHKEQSLSK